MGGILANPSGEPEYNEERFITLLVTIHVRFGTLTAV